VQLMWFSRSLPENIIPFCLVLKGYSDEIKISENRFKKEKIHTDRW